MYGTYISKAKQNKVFLFAFLIAVFLGALSWWNPFFCLLAALLVIFLLLLLLFSPGFFIFFLAILPFFPATNIALGVDLASLRLAVVALFAVTAVRGLLKKSIKLPSDKISFFLVLFLVWATGSLFYSPVTDRTLRKLLVFFTILPLYFVTYSVNSCL